MDITNFDPDKLVVPASSYYSDTYQQDFEITQPGDTSLPRRSLVKLTPVSKQDVKKYLGDFRSKIPGRNYNLPILGGDEFYDDPRHHQLFRFQYGDGRDEVCLFFRDLGSSQLEEDLLEGSCESVMLREHARCEELDANLREKYGEEKINEILTDEMLAEYQGQEIRQMAPKTERRYKTFKVLCLLDTLAYLKS